MDNQEIIRFIHGLQKKHDKNFSVALKYKTSTGKVRKRYGEYVDLLGEHELILFNRDKGKEGRYPLENIIDIKKK